MEKIWLKKYPHAVDPEIDINLYHSIPEVLAEACLKFRDKPAFTNMGVTLSFLELETLVNHFTSFLQNELRLKKGDRIAIQMPNVLQFPVVAFAALKAGLVVVNTNPLYTAHEMQHQFKDSGAKAIVILANYAGLLEKIIHQTDIESVIVTEIGDLFPFPKNLVVNSVVKYVKKMVPAYHLPQSYKFKAALEIGAMKAPVHIPLGHEDLAFLQYTGGTTGVSKGAMLSHKNVLANMLQIISWMKTKLVPGEETSIAALPMYHIFSLTVNSLAFMWYGSHNVLITNPRDFKSFIADMKKYKFTTMTGVNTLFNALMNQPDFKSVDFSHVKVSVAGAMSLQRAVCERWTRETKSLLVEGYGLTEASPVVCVNPIDGGEKIGTIGLPVPSTNIKLIDEDGHEVGVGGIGELCVQGPQVMKGYWLRPDETANVLKDGWLLTGDIATVDEEGYFKIVDRKKDMILVSGFNVYPNEVEEAISSHPGVLEVAAVGVPDPHSGEVVKAVVVRKDSQLTSQDIIAHAKLTLTNYKVPKIVEFRTELPKTNVGKILRRALREA